jgi:Flp pilus assembly protein protease CpaA
VIALVSLSLRKWKPVKNAPVGSWIYAAQKGSGVVPYGIAIALGALASFIAVGYFSFEKWGMMF